MDTDRQIWGLWASLKLFLLWVNQGVAPETAGGLGRQLGEGEMSHKLRSV